MMLFWERGYEATSIADLTQALGVTPPSIYTAFGDKKRLFLEAVALYVGDEEERSRSIAKYDSTISSSSRSDTNRPVVFRSTARRSPVSW